MYSELNQVTIVQNGDEMIEMQFMSAYYSKYT
jgi:hypothetical protein